MQRSCRFSLSIVVVCCGLATSGCDGVSLPGPQEQAGSSLTEEDIERDLAIVGEAREALRENQDGDWAVRTLFEALEHEEPRVRHKAILALKELDSRATTAVPALVKLSQSELEEIRARAVAALGRLGPTAKQAAPELAKALQDESPAIRAAAADALAAIEKEVGGDFAGLVGALNDVDEETRWQAAKALGSAALSRFQEANRDDRRR